MRDLSHILSACRGLCSRILVTFLRRLHGLCLLFRLQNFAIFIDVSGSRYYRSGRCCAATLGFGG